METDFGIDCPFSNRIYQLSADSNHDIVRKRRNSDPKESQFSSIFGNGFPIYINNHNYEDTDCEHYLKIGCNNNDYTIYKKCEYTFSNRESSGKTKNRKIKKDSRYSAYSQPIYKQNTNQQLPVVESETNRICLAYWKLDANSIKQRSYHEEEDDAELKNSQDEVYAVLSSRQSNAENYTVTCSVRFLFSN